MSRLVMLDHTQQGASAPSTLTNLETLDSTKVAALNRLGLHTVADLLHYQPIHQAQLIHAAALGQLSETDRLQQLLQPDSESMSPLEILRSPLSVLAAVTESEVTLLADLFQINTILQLARFPPFLEAQSLLTGEPTATFSEPPSAPAELLPEILNSTATTIRYSSIVREIDMRNLTIGFARTPPKISLGHIFHFGKGQTPVVYLGYVAGFEQRWINRGTHLGEIVHSIPLAPGESRNIALLDWKRSSLTQRNEDTGVTEQVNSTQIHKRALDEVARAVAEEHQFGKTSTEANTAATSASFVAAGAVVGGIGGGITGALTGLAVGNAANVAGGAPTIAGAVAGTALGTAAGAAAGGLVYSGVHALGMIESDSSGDREVVGDVMQRITQSTSQKSSAIRSLWSTIVLEDYQGESQNITTSNITNYNHMHALTVQYYEVLQHYRTEIGLTKADPLLFLPFKPLDFNHEQIQLFWPYIKEVVQDEISESIYQLAFEEIPPPEEIDEELPTVPDEPFDPAVAMVKEILVRTKTGLSATTIGVQIVKKDTSVVYLHHPQANTPQTPTGNETTPAKDLSALNPPGVGGTATERIDYFGLPGLILKVNEIDKIRVVNSAGIQLGTLAVDVAVRYTIHQPGHADQRIDFDDSQGLLGTLDFDGAEALDTHWRVYNRLLNAYTAYENARLAYEEALATLTAEENEAQEAYEQALAQQEAAREEVYDAVRWRKYQFTRIILGLLEPEQLTELLDALSIDEIPLHTIAHTVPIGVAGNHIILKLKHLRGRTVQRYLPQINRRLFGVRYAPEVQRALLNAFEFVSPQIDHIDTEQEARHYAKIVIMHCRYLYMMAVIPSPETSRDTAQLIDDVADLNRQVYELVDLNTHAKLGDQLAALRQLVLEALYPHVDNREALRKLLGYASDILHWAENEARNNPVIEEVYLPTSGVFAEAILGRSNAAEKLDMTRFFNWQDSPIPHAAPEIAPTDPNEERAVATELTPTVPAATINLVNPVSFPDPVGLSGVLQAVQNGEMFRDMSKAEQLTTILGNLATLAAEMGRASSQMTGDAAQQAMQSATDIGKQVGAMTQSLMGSAERLAAQAPKNMTEKGATLNALENLKNGQGSIPSASNDGVSSPSHDNLFPSAVADTLGITNPTATPGSPNGSFNTDNNLDGTRLADTSGTLPFGAEGIAWNPHDDIYIELLTRVQALAETDEFFNQLRVSQDEILSMSKDQLTGLVPHYWQARVAYQEAQDFDGLNGFHTQIDRLYMSLEAGQYLSEAEYPGLSAERIPASQSWFLGQEKGSVWLLLAGLYRYGQLNHMVVQPSIWSVEAGAEAVKNNFLQRANTVIANGKTRLQQMLEWAAAAEQGLPVPPDFGQQWQDFQEKMKRYIADYKRVGQLLAPGSPTREAVLTQLEEDLALYETQSAKFQILYNVRHALIVGPPEAAYIEMDNFIELVSQEAEHDINVAYEALPPALKMVWSHTQFYLLFDDSAHTQFWLSVREWFE